MQTPPIHPVRGLGALKAMRANQVEFFASTQATGEVVHVPLGPPRLAPQVYVAHTPRAVEEVLSAKTYSHYPKSPHRFYDMIKEGLGNGILTAWGDDWLRQKRFIQPVFTRARVEGYLEGMVDATERLAARWADAGGSVDLGEGMVHLTLEIVTEALFGTDGSDFEEVVRHRFPEVNESILRRAASAVRLPLGVPTPANLRYNAARNDLLRTCEELIERRRRTPGGEDLASLLIAARDGDERLSPTEVRDQVLVFLLAGHETTSTALTFALHLLGRHPEVQDRVRQEVASVLGSARPTAHQLMADLPYTTAVLKETMRLYPSAPFTGRRTATDSVIAGHAVPAGADVVLSVWSIHRRPDLWPDPLRFDPERFVGDQHDRDRYAWVPFGAGPRACIGQHFSMLESVAALALLVRALQFSAPPGTSDTVPVASGVTLYPTSPVRSHVTPVA